MLPILRLLFINPNTRFDLKSYTRKCYAKEGIFEPHGEDF